MPDELKSEAPAGGAERGTLDEGVREHLGRKLRFQYEATSKPPEYLGDPALPPEFEHQLVRVASSVAAHEKGVEAVQEALAGANHMHLLAWCKRERESLQMQREMLISGRFRLRENVGSEEHDISDQHIELLTEKMAQLDALLSS